MQLPRLPRRYPDRLIAAGILVGIATSIAIIMGAPVLAALLGAVALAGLLLLLQK